MKPRFSIRYKFLSVITLLLSACVCLYLLLAIRVFKSDKTELIYDLNRSMVTNLSSEVETQFRGVSAKMELFALLSHEKGSTFSTVKDLIKKDSEIVYVSLAQAKSTTKLQTYMNPEFLKTYALEDNFFEDRLLKDRPVPYDHIQETGEAIWNATIPDGPPVVGFGKSVIKENESGIPIGHYAVIAYVRADKLLKAFSLVQMSEAFMVNEKGQILLHSDSQLMSAGKNLSDLELVKKAIGGEVKTSVLRFDVNGEETLGAFSKSFKNKVIVVAQVSGTKAFAAVSGLAKRSFLFSLIILTVAFITAVLLSRSLTRPINNLMDRMVKVGEGDLKTEIDVRTRDEIAVLANRFNSMIRDLRTSREQLEEINRELENKVKERTRQLEEQNHAVKEAQEALIRTTRLASVGEIAGRAAHEVLNPLTSLMTRVQKVQKRINTEMKQENTLLTEIKGGWQSDYKAGGFDKLISSWRSPSQVNKGQMLWDEDLTNIEQVTQNLSKELEQLMKDTDFVIQEGNRIGRIVSTMRSLSIVRGNKEPHSAHKLLHECVNIMADLFSQENIKVHEKFHASIDKIMVDKDEFIQSVTNLLRNSLQAVAAVVKKDPTHAGAVVLRTKIEEKMFMVEIDDNGVGIEEDNKKKLFESQFSTKSHEEGTGLGLSISRRFIRAFGGDIELVSTEKRKSTVFRISLPLDGGSSKEVAA